MRARSIVYPIETSPKTCPTCKSPLRLIAPDDGEVLRQMRDIFIAAERWEAAANVWARLVHVEEGEAKAEAALALTDTLERLERSEEAILKALGLPTCAPKLWPAQPSPSQSGGEGGD